jgi:hypothetical protein
MKLTLRNIVALLVFLGLSTSVRAAAEDFYQGKTIRFIVGVAAGPPVALASTPFG